MTNKEETKTCLTCEYWDELESLCYAHDLLVSDEDYSCNKWKSHKKAIELEVSD